MALGYVLWFLAPHSPSSSNGHDNGKTLEEHNIASRMMVKLLEQWQSFRGMQQNFWNSD
jgi:hypothetical protein